MDAKYVVTSVKIHPIKLLVKNYFKIFSTPSSIHSKSFSIRDPNSPKSFPAIRRPDNGINRRPLLVSPFFILRARRFPPKPLATVVDRPDAAAHAWPTATANRADTSLSSLFLFLPAEAARDRR